MTDASGDGDDPVVAVTPPEGPEARLSAEGPGRSWSRLRKRSLRRWTVRLLSIAGVALLLLSLTGWWLSSRVLSDDGFGDVVAKTVQQQPVRDFIGDQATLRLARANVVITAARPVVAKTVAEILNDPAVISAVHAFAAGAHHQILELNNRQRTNAAAASSAATIRATLQSIDPKLASKLPNSVLAITSDISQSDLVDVAVRATRWVNLLFLPVGALGVALLLVALLKAKEPIRAVRFIGFTMAIAGAIPVGLGLASPLFGYIGNNPEPARGAAVAAFIKVLLGRLVGAGWALSIVGFLLAYAPGRDGASMGTRVLRARDWFLRVRDRPRWQLTGAAAGVVVALLLVTRPARLAYWIGLLLAGLAVLCAFVVVLRQLGALVPGQPVRRIRKRQLVAIGTAMLGCFVLTTTGTATVVALTNRPATANPRASGCNGSVELCVEPINQIVWAGSHNAMSSTAYNFLSAEHTLTIPEQLNQGARALLLDAYYGYRQGGIVRTNLAGGIDRAGIQSEYGQDAIKDLDRLGALTGVADTSGKKQDVYLCHDLCELGAVKASDIFGAINTFLNRNTTDVVYLDIEDYIQPRDLEAALKAGHLWDRIYSIDPTKAMPTLFDIVNPPEGQKDAKRRVIVTSELHGGQVPWLVGTYQLLQETPFTFTSTSQFNCNPNRGAADNPLLLVNHWLRPDGPPDPGAAATVNSAATENKRLQECILADTACPTCSPSTSSRSGTPSRW